MLLLRWSTVCKCMTAIMIIVTSHQLYTENWTRRQDLAWFRAESTHVDCPGISSSGWQILECEVHFAVQLMNWGRTRRNGRVDRLKYSQRWMNDGDDKEMMHIIWNAYVKAHSPSGKMCVVERIQSECGYEFSLYHWYSCRNKDAEPTTTQTLYDIVPQRSSLTG